MAVLVDLELEDYIDMGQVIDLNQYRAQYVYLMEWTSGSGIPCETRLQAASFDAAEQEAEAIAKSEGVRHYVVSRT